MKNQNKLLKKELLNFKKFQSIISAEDAIKKSYHNKIKFLKTNQTKQEETALLLKELDQIAKNNTIHLNTIKPLECTDHEFYLKTKVDIKFETDLVSLIKFLYNLVESDLTINIENIKISASGLHKDTIKCQIIVSRILVAQ